MTRKLPRWLRKLNVVEQIIMGLLALTNLVMIETFDIDPKYYQIMSVICSAFPVFWTRVLDTSKKFVEDLTPVSTVMLETGSIHSESSTTDSRT